jgi:probable phosphoglycerate mutase
VTPTRWIFLRHGQSEANRDGTLAGWRDSPLTPEGREEARAAGDLLVPHPFEHVVVSDLVRARDTASLALGRWAELTGKPLPPTEIDPALRERTVGEWEGASRATLREQGTMEMLASWEGRAPGGGESHHDLARRVFPALATRLGRQVLFVCHGGVIRVVLGMLDDLPYDDVGRSTLGNAEIAARLVTEGRWQRAYDRACGSP